MCCLTRYRRAQPSHALTSRVLLLTGRIVAPELNNSLPQYARIGDPRAHRIVRLPSSTSGDITSFLEAVCAEKEIENLSSGFLQISQGLVAIQ